MEDITRGLSNLKLDREVEEYLHAQELAHPTLLPKYLKSVACTTSKSLYSHKSCSGWSNQDKWVGYGTLCREEATLLARQIVGELNYTFHADAGFDHRDWGDSGYWPGRFQACHAEIQLMAYICDKLYRGPTALDQSFDIHIYPRPVCDYCHDFARHIFLTTGLQFIFYLDGRRDLPNCKHCQQTIQVGFFCPTLACAKVDLLISLDSYGHAAVKFAQSLKISRRC